MPPVVAGSLGQHLHQPSPPPLPPGNTVDNALRRASRCPSWCEEAEGNVRRQNGGGARRSKVAVTAGEGGGQIKSQKVSAKLPPNVQGIIARGGLKKWVKSQIEAS